jgi:predicted nucleic acid-binding protein
VIYVDSSVALSQLIFEARSPPTEFWEQPLNSSRLLQYEVWDRMHAYRLTASRADDAHALLALVDMVDMSEPVLSRALQPFPVAIRTLDSLHLATMEYLRMQGSRVELASYDHRLTAAARALNIPLAAL